MLFLSLLIIVIITIIIFLAKDLEGDWIGNLLIGLTASTVLCTIAGLIIYVVGSLLILPFDKETAVVADTKKQEIVALADNSGTSGRFFLGSGSVDGDMFYSYMVMQDGYKTIKTMKAKDVLIDDSGKVEPCIEYRELQPPDAGEGIYWWFWTPTESQVIIHIPPNSVTTTYEIDLK